MSWILQQQTGQSSNAAGGGAVKHKLELWEKEVEKEQEGEVYNSAATAGKS